MSKLRFVQARISKSLWWWLSRISKAWVFLAFCPSLSSGQDPHGHNKEQAFDLSVRAHRSPGLRSGFEVIWVAVLGASWCWTYLRVDSVPQGLVVGWPSAFRVWTYENCRLFLGTSLPAISNLMCSLHGHKAIQPIYQHQLNIINSCLLIHIRIYLL
jgi:hypothetical protein